MKAGSPEWNLHAWLELFQGPAMQRSWEIGGAYATWRMTIDVEDAVDRPHWRESDLESLAAHFQEVVFLCEMSEQLERSG